LFLLFSCCLGLAGSAQAQQSSNRTSARKLIRKVDPTYPALAKSMHLAGTVKVFAVVAPDGSVKSVEPVGGGPLLVQASVMP
jgi:outer membrane biosynthesis protein TonB